MEGNEVQMKIDTTNIGAYQKGCAFLAAGGGGDIVAGLQTRHAIEEHGSVQVVDLDELADDALIMPCADMGAPLVFIEKIANGGEGELLRDEIERVAGRPLAALMPISIGGSNGLTPVMWAARLGLPLVDCDAMGRAYPRADLTTFELAGISLSPACVVDERGNSTVVRAVDAQWLERLARRATIEFGGAAAMACSLTAAEIRRAAIRGSVSRALAAGLAIESATVDPVGELCDHVDARVLVRGKVVEIERRIEDGFVFGTLVVEGTGSDRGRVLRLEFQNEFLVLLEDEEPLVMVPDILSVLDPATAESMSTERVRYGSRCVVVGAPTGPEWWRTPEGLALGGPSAFGYDFDFVPVEEVRIP